MMETLVHAAVTALEAAGALTILIGVASAAAAFLRRIRRVGVEFCYRSLRADLGRSILLGLELLVAADILNSMAIRPTLEDLALLAGIVLIRTFLSVSIEVEINGHWPWERTRLARRGTPSRTEAARQPRSLTRRQSPHPETPGGRDERKQ